MYFGKLLLTDGWNPIRLCSVALLAQLLWTRGFILSVPPEPQPLHNKDADFCSRLNVWNI